jgi:hypothetical protein
MMPTSVSIIAKGLRLVAAGVAGRLVLPARRAVFAFGVATFAFLEVLLCGAFALRETGFFWASHGLDKIIKVSPKSKEKKVREHLYIEYFSFAWSEKLYRII